LANSGIVIVNFSVSILIPSKYSAVCFRKGYSVNTLISPSKRVAKYYTPLYNFLTPFLFLSNNCRQGGTDA
jgi:hypothetical protein